MVNIKTHGKSKILNSSWEQFRVQDLAVMPALKTIKAEVVLKSGSEIFTELSYTADKKHLFAFNAKIIFYSRDFGEHWNKLAFQLPENETLAAISSYNGEKIYLVSDNKFLRRKMIYDAKISSGRQQGDSLLIGKLDSALTKLRIEHLACVTQNVTYGLGRSSTNESFVACSKDGGNTWNILYQLGNQRFRSLHFVDSKTGFLVAESGYFFMTDDAANSWRKPGRGAYMFFNNEKGYKAELSYEADRFNTTFYKTGDGGITWQKIFSGLPSINTYTIGLINNNDTFLLGNGFLLSTKDDGKNWIYTGVSPAPKNAGKALCVNDHVILLSADSICRVKIN
jgi:photosystem II stability/assembly factor-like uncharacterized protein